MVAACLEAAQATGSQRWQQAAQRCYAWFLGENDLGIPLVDLHSGACHDALTPEGPHPNQGTETTLAYLQASAELHLAALEPEATPVILAGEEARVPAEADHFAALQAG